MNAVREMTMPTLRRQLDRAVTDVRTGRFERSLSALTAAGALVTAAEIFFEHDRASFGNRLMWLPVYALILGLAVWRAPRVMRFWFPAVMLSLLIFWVFASASWSCRSCWATASPSPPPAPASTT